MAPPANQRRRWEIWMGICRQVYMRRPASRPRGDSAPGCLAERSSQSVSVEKGVELRSTRQPGAAVSTRAVEGTSVIV